MNQIKTTNPYAEFADLIAQRRRDEMTRMYKFNAHLIKPHYFQRSTGHGFWRIKGGVMRLRKNSMGLFIPSSYHVIRPKEIRRLNQLLDMKPVTINFDMN